MTLVGSATGHPNVRATHGKTLELVREQGIGECATCVIGVAARLDEEAAAGLHGRVELTIECGGASATVRGRLNPAFRPGDPLIVRRAPAVTRDALVIDADVAAADLPRSLVAELAREGARIAVWIQELVDEPAPAVLVVDIVPGTGRSGAVTAALREARAAIAAAHEAGHTVLPHPDLPPSDAVLAVAGIAAAGATEIDARTQRPRDVEWDAIDCALVSNVPADRLDKWLRRAEREGASRGGIGLDLGTPREQFIPWKPGEPIDIPGARGRTAALALIVGPQSGERTPDTSSVSRPEPRTSR